MPILTAGIALTARIWRSSLTEFMEPLSAVAGEGTASQRLFHQDVARLRRVYDHMTEPRHVISMGSCANWRGQQRGFSIALEELGQREPAIFMVGNSGCNDTTGRSPHAHPDLGNFRAWI